MKTILERISIQRILYILITKPELNTATKLMKFTGMTYCYVHLVLKELTEHNLLTKSKRSRTVMVKLTKKGIIIADSIKRMYDTIYKFESDDKFKK